MELCEIFSYYGVDAALISLVNAALCLLLKKTALKNKPKLITVLAYISGTILYAVYESFSQANAMYAFENIGSVTENGMTIGTLTYLLCAAINKFLGGGGVATASDGLEELLAGIVAEDKRQACADKIMQAALEKSGEELKNSVNEILNESGAQADEISLALIVSAAEKLAEAAKESNAADNANAAAQDDSAENKDASAADENISATTE